MELTSNEVFLKWAAEYGIGLTPDEPKVLTYIPERGDSRFWETPYGEEQVLALLTLMLDSFDDWQSMWAYKRGEWTFEHADQESPSEQALEAAHHWTGIPKGYRGSVRFDQPDRARLVLFLMLLEKRGDSIRSDIFLVPDHAQQILWMNHNYAIFAFFADPSKIAPFVAHMNASGYLLPTDPTQDFLWGQWLGETPGGWKYIWENPSWR